MDGTQFNILTLKIVVPVACGQELTAVLTTPCIPSERNINLFEQYNLM